jgi:1-acyl-sn-glycerol-3-phosphate acyltransferase
MEERLTVPMSDLFYSLVRAYGYPVFYITSHPTVLHAERFGLVRRGPFILAANHQSPFDIPILMRHCPRPLDFVSITEVFAKPLIGWFYGSMNAFPLQRARPDALTVRTIFQRLRRGRAVAMFPEGRLTPVERSVVHGGPIRPGIGRIALAAGVPILPVAIANSQAYYQPRAWLPLRSTLYGVNIGHPIFPPPGSDKRQAAEALESQLRGALIQLHAELLRAMSPV